jgi:hypothetical protein
MRSALKGPQLKDLQIGDAQGLTHLLLATSARGWESAIWRGGYGAVTVKCAVTDEAPEALTVTVA